jgi:hypothetical protein
MHKGIKTASQRMLPCGKETGGNGWRCHCTMWQVSPAKMPPFSPQSHWEAGRKHSVPHSLTWVPFKCLVHSHSSSVILGFSCCLLTFESSSLKYQDPAGLIPVLEADKEAFMTASRCELTLKCNYWSLHVFKAALCGPYPGSSLQVSQPNVVVSPGYNVILAVNWSGSYF